MEQIKEMWELIFTWLGNGKKMLIGVGFLVVGVVWQMLSGIVLEQGPFLFMSAGLMCFVNALFSRLGACNINLLLYLMVNILAAETGIAVAGMDIENVMMYALCGLVLIAAWVLQSFLIRVPEALKRTALAFFETLLSLVAMTVVFLVPILIRAWQKS